MGHGPQIFRRQVLGGLAATTLGLTAAQAFAQGAGIYPNQIIRIVMPYPAGGAIETLARMMASHLATAWNQTVIVENKPGASGAIGNDMVAKAASDGYTVLMAITAIVQSRH